MTAPPIPLVAELGVFDDIEPGFARGFVDQLKATEGGPVNIHISSAGGDLFEAIAAAEALRTHPGHTVAFIDGLAASAASVLMLAADEVVIAPSALVMIHSAASMLYGTAHDHRVVAGVLDKADTTIASAYLARSGQGTVRSWLDAMHEETWMTSSEAVASGLVDRVAESPRLASPVLALRRTLARMVEQRTSVAAMTREGLRAALPGHAVAGVVLAQAGGQGRRPSGRRPMPSMLPALRALHAVRR